MSELTEEIQKLIKNLEEMGDLLTAVDTFIPDSSLMDAFLNQIKNINTVIDNAKKSLKFR